jgi:hypothetical protein
MPGELPPSGAWRGYYLYGHSGTKHRMSLSLLFRESGRLEGDGVDDVGPFGVEGHFESATSVARWTKSYVGMHTVEYSGLYCQRQICGDWKLHGMTGGFWIWPRGESQFEFGEEGVEEEEPVAAKTAL